MQQLVSGRGLVDTPAALPHRPALWCRFHDAVFFPNAPVFLSPPGEALSTEVQRVVHHDSSTVPAQGLRTLSH